MALIKNDNKQKKHKGENIIGKIIYGFLLFAPLLNILVTCLYITFNKNAYLSYSQIEETTISNVTGNYNANALNNDFTYTFTYNGRNETRLGAEVKDNQTNLFELCDIDRNTYTIRSWNTSGLPTQDMYIDVTNIQTSTNSTIRHHIDVGFQFTCVVTTLSTWGNTPTTFTNLNMSITFIQNITGKLDNAFIYGTEKTEQSNLFNWSKTTGTYTVLNNTCNLLGITNTFVPMLLAYWLIISIIYFIYDIALILVWMVHKKIHELTDAI